MLVVSEQKERPEGRVGLSVAALAARDMQKSNCGLQRLEVGLLVGEMVG
jgi:hypothetical protein